MYSCTMEPLKGKNILFVVTCAWLQIPRVLSWPIAFFLALIFVVVEVFLRSREVAHEYGE